MQEFIFDSEYFDLSATLECGQIFRYEKCGGSYNVYSADKHCGCEQNGLRTTFITAQPDYFRTFFALDEDYAARNTQLVGQFPELAFAANAGRGIRLLRQEPFEMLISFIISANNNIPRIKGIIARLCELVGERVDGYNAFPTLPALQSLTMPQLSAIGLGYRADYIYHAVRQLSMSLLAEIQAAPTAAAAKLLCSIKGIGQKVADCVLLFGLNKGDVFPVDTWMEQSLATEELNNAAKIRAHYLSRYGENAGLAQQYIYHYNRNIVKSAATVLRENSKNMAAAKNTSVV